jgi:hypothetical protein
VLANFPIKTARPWCLVCFFLGCVAPASDGTEYTANAEPGTVIPPGTRGRAPHFEMQVSVPSSCPLPAYVLASQGLKRVGVKVTLTAHGELQVPANPYYAYLIDAESVAYEATLGGCEPDLSPTLVEPGQSAQGWLSFDIPQRARAAKLSYAPRLPDPEELTFRLTPP